MARPAKRAAPTKETGGRPQGLMKSRSVRLSDETLREWKVWMAINDMNYEESIRFFLDHHPVDAEKLKEAYRFIR